MKAILYVFLAVLFLLPVQTASAQGPRTKKKVAVKSKSTKAKKVSAKRTSARRPAVKKTASSSEVKMAVQPIGRTPPAVYSSDKLPFFPPSPNFVPSTKNQMMISIRCSENKFLWVTTESIIYFSPTFVKVEVGGPILVLQANGEYTAFNSTSAEQNEYTRPADVKFAEKIIRSIRPKKLTIMPKHIAMEKDQMTETDPFELVEIIRDHIGRETTDVHVQKYGNCYKLPPNS